MALVAWGLQRGKVGSLLWFIRSSLWAACVCTNQSHVFFVGCLSLGPRKNDLTNYWALGPFVRPFTSLVDPGDIYPPQEAKTPPIKSIMFLKEDSFLPRLHSWDSSFGTTLEQKQQKFAASSPTTTWVRKPWVRSVLSQVLPVKIKDSQGYASLRESR